MADVSIWLYLPFSALCAETPCWCFARCRATLLRQTTRGPWACPKTTTRPWSPAAPTASVRHDFFERLRSLQNLVIGLPWNTCMLLRLFVCVKHCSCTSMDVVVEKVFPRDKQFCGLPEITSPALSVQAPTRASRGAARRCPTPTAPLRSTAASRNGVSPGRVWPQPQTLALTLRPHPIRPWLATGLS